LPQLSGTDAIVRFGDFEVDPGQATVRRNGAPVTIQEKPLQLLLALLDRPGQLMTREELRNRLWPADAFGAFEDGLNTAVRKLRIALNDSAEIPQFIETVPKRGYRFIADVTIVHAVEANPAAKPALQIESTPTAEESRTEFKISNRWILAAILLVAVTAGGTLLFAHHDKKVLTERDAVVLADFDNSAGDPVFDGTLRQGMAVQLEQSPFLNLISEERIQQTLRLMDQPADARLTPAVAREICERTASTAILDGSIARLGSQYVLGLRATDCQSGKVIDQEQVQAARKEDLLTALDQIAGQFRSRAGESLPSVQKYDTPLAEATTSSLEALKIYSQGTTMITQGGLTASLPFFQQAIELDPNFAMAYEEMTCACLNQPNRAAENSRKAYELRGRVSERERLTIEATYYQYATGELEKSISSLELWQQIYPRDHERYNIDIIYRKIGNPEKALEEGLHALQLAPESAWNYENLATDYVNLNRLDLADDIYKLSDQRHLVAEGRARSLYLLAFLRGDIVQMAQRAASVAGKPDEEDAMLASQADTAACYGKAKEARQLTRRAMESVLQKDVKEIAAAYQAEAAEIEADEGRREQAHADAIASMRLASNREVQRMAALALARSGDMPRAEKLAAGLDRDFPLDTMVQSYWLPVIRAAIALQRRDPDKAISLLESAKTTELGGSGPTSPSMFPVYLRGEAYLMLHDGNRAAAEFQKFLDHRGLVRNSPWGALARLGMARAYAMQSDITKARIAYRDFLTIWKDSDPDLPLLKQAKTEYAKLQ
jgi:DNA-binding winged helix-turn-helix (wHTH) protein/tetratricopeptide (TPR) repeat protein